MFSTLQLRTWTTAHLNTGAWYLDCVTTFTPLPEVELKRLKEDVGVALEDMLELVGIEDEETCKKAIKRRAESDRKKAQKVKEATEKVEKREKEKLEKAAQKVIAKAVEKGKGKGKGNKNLSDLRKENDKEPIGASSTVDAGSQLESSRGQGRKRDSSYEEFSQVPNLLHIRESDDFNVHELIVNSSLQQMLGGDSGPLPQAYEDLKEFMNLVSGYSYMILWF